MLLPDTVLVRLLLTSTVGRHPSPARQVENVYHGLAFHGMRRCLLAYFFNSEIMLFYFELGEEFGGQTFLDKNGKAVLSRGSCIHSLFDTGSNTYCCLLGIPDTRFLMS